MAPCPETAAATFSSFTLMLSQAGGAVSPTMFVGVVPHQHQEPSTTAGDAPFSLPAMVEATIPRRRAAAIMALLALCAVAALLSVRAAQGGLPAAGGANVLMSKLLGKKIARVQLAGDDGGNGDDDAEEEEEPPFGEPTELPDPACDIEALQNCLGAMQALEESLPEAERELLSGGEDSEVAHEFCHRAKGHFQCACQACDLSKLSTWNNDYWTKDRCVWGLRFQV